MPLISLADVKNRFPRWESYCTLKQSDTTADAEARLTLARDQAEGELLDYVDVEDADMTARLERHLMNIVRYNCFDLKFGSEDYDTKPTIVRRYEQTIETLTALRAGTLPEPHDPTSGTDETPEDVKVQAKRRRFDEWFYPRPPDQDLSGDTT